MIRIPAAGPHGLYDWGSEAGGQAVKAITTVATVAAENAGMIGAGTALGLTFVTAPAGDLIFPNSAGGSEQDRQNWLRQRQEAAEDYRWKKRLEYLDSEKVKKLIELIEMRGKAEEERNRRKRCP